ncbi:MAG: type II toxin-antitoxin system VapB family antitoxin [Burkholderiales bacterium]|jgi:antitoxin VapB|nr:type II toxin-antitoxin system VapB family antitoxin [Burkholderiales bacterium]
MTIARVFKSGNSQAIRLPKAFRVTGSELEISRRGAEIVLREPLQGLARAFDLLCDLPDDFMADGRNDAKPQSRKGL